jgi:hypothetical protein
MRSISQAQKIGLNFCLLRWNLDLKSVLLHIINLTFVEILFLTEAKIPFSILFQLSHIYFVWRGMKRTLRIIYIMMNPVFTANYWWLPSPSNFVCKAFMSRVLSAKIVNILCWRRRKTLVVVEFFSWSYVFNTITVLSGFTKMGNELIHENLLVKGMLCINKTRNWAWAKCHMHIWNTHTGVCIKLLCNQSWYCINISLAW